MVELTNVVLPIFIYLYNVGKVTQTGSPREEVALGSEKNGVDWYKTHCLSTVSGYEHSVGLLLC